MLMKTKTAPNDITLTPLPSSLSSSSSSSSLFKEEKPRKFYDMRHLLSLKSPVSGGTNGLIINNYGINSKNSFITRICCHMMKGVQRNIQKCVAALVLISFFSIIFFTQYMDSSPLVGWVSNDLFLFFVFLYFLFMCVYRLLSRVCLFYHDLSYQREIIYKFCDIRSCVQIDFHMARKKME